MLESCASGIPNSALGGSEDCYNSSSKSVRPKIDNSDDDTEKPKLLPLIRVAHVMANAITNCMNSSAANINCAKNKATEIKAGGDDGDALENSMKRLNEDEALDLFSRQNVVTCTN